MGTHAFEGGVNFAFFSRNATRVRLELYDRSTDATPARSIDLDPSRNRTGDVWHVWVADIRAGQLYGYRVDGPYRPQLGLRFNFNKLLLDPYAKAIDGIFEWNQSLFGYNFGDEDSRNDDDSAASMPKCVVINPFFDWGVDRPPGDEYADTAKIDWPMPNW